MARVSVQRPAGRTWWPSSSILRRVAGPDSSCMRTSWRGLGRRSMAEGERPQDEALLRGPRVRLRPLERADLPRYQELFSDPGINLLYGGLGVPEHLNRLQRRFDAGEFDTTDRFLLLVIDAESTLIGDSAYLGRGYGAEASTLLLDYAFGVLGYHKINLDLFEYNARALAMYERL